MYFFGSSFSCLFGIFCWQDVVEILFFTALFYLLIRWLSQDRTKNLVGYLYGYAVVFAVAHFCHLATMQHFLLFFCPSLLFFFLLFHEKTLQRNFISLTKNPLPKKAVADWPATLISTMLRAAHHKQTVLCLLEHRDSVSQWIQTIHQSENNVTGPILELLLTHPDRDDSSMLWVTTDGLLKSVSCTFSSSEVRETALERALYYSTYTDLLFFSMIPHQDGSIYCSFVAQGVATHKLSANNLLARIKKEVGMTHFSSFNKESYAPSSIQR